MMRETIPCCLIERPIRTTIKQANYHDVLGGTVSAYLCLVYHQVTIAFEFQIRPMELLTIRSNARTC